MSFASKTKMSDAAFFISPSVAAQMLTIKTSDFLSLKKTIGYQKTGFKMKSAKLLVKAESIETPVQTENVLGYLEGTDLKDELVVVTAHYDHLGMQEEKIFRGADDDGTGVITVMSLAKAFSIAKKDGKGPRRSILFMTFTGEEHGLLGSEYYSDFPVFPLANTVCDLNIDMTGRLDADHAKDSNYVYVIGSDKLSDELKQVNEQANSSCCGLKLDYKFDAPDDPNKFYYRSDHYNFAKKNIPVIFYFNGVHEDYHQSTDTIDKIVFSKVLKIAQLVFTTTWNLANQSSRLKLDK
jgi:Zn-dependent M28 family amino/carboxypeptidase